MAKSAGKRKGRKGTAGKKSDKKHGEEPAEKPAPTLTERVRACFGVSYVSALCIFYVVRVFGATSNTIPDCDEVYNYWEPTHQLLYGRGFQTWEYSPEFALRSYVYVGAHAVLAKVGQVVTLLSAENKVLAFYCIRFALAFVCAVSEASLYRSVAHLCGELVAGVAAMFMLTSAGMFHASSAFLPSTFAMYAVMWAYACWCRRSCKYTMLAGCIAVLVGWPFAGLVFVPMGLHMMRRAGVFEVAKWGVFWSALILAGSVAVDHHYYQMLVVPVWNIVKYNALGGGGGAGADLYGVEPVSFYLKNLFLNFNVVFLLALASLVLLTVDRSFGGMIGRTRAATMVAPFFVWLGFMSSRPHKEERFMFVVYPVLCVAAAMAVVSLRRFLRDIEERSTSLPLKPEWKRLSNLFVVAVLFVATIVSSSRVARVSSAYHAPITVFKHFNKAVVPTLSTAAGPYSLCMGKEWYRFPSSFFLPDHPVQVELKFLESGFTGQLPQPYAAVNATSAIQAGFNDLNQGDPSRFVRVEDCDFIVDLDLGDDQAEPSFVDLLGWDAAITMPFLDAARSPGLTRAFAVPFWDRNTYANYTLLRHERTVDTDKKARNARRARRAKREADLERETSHADDEL